MMIHQAYPCNSITKSAKKRAKNVEMCPESSVEAQNKA
jgi:hypothetical protein